MNEKKMREQMDEGARLAQEMIDYCNQAIREQPELRAEFQVIIDQGHKVLESHAEYVALCEEEDRQLKVLGQDR